MDQHLQKRAANGDKEAARRLENIRCGLRNKEASRKEAIRLAYGKDAHAIELKMMRDARGGNSHEIKRAVYGNKSIGGKSIGWTQ